jgi:hypothetical protein
MMLKQPLTQTNQRMTPTVYHWLANDFERFKLIERERLGDNGHPFGHPPNQRPFLFRQNTSFIAHKRSFHLEHPLIIINSLY